MPDRLRLGTRGSDLALRQAGMVRDALTAAHPDLEVELVEVTTTGDLDKRRLDVIAGRGVFVRELDLKVADGTLDGAVHSLKDVPTELIEGVALVAHLPRGPVGDALVSRHVEGARAGSDGDRDAGRDAGPGSGGSDDAEDVIPALEGGLSDLPEGARVGTSSPRRRAQLKRARDDLEVVDLRGNVDTRVRKGLEELDGAVLARAGLHRLGAERLRDVGLAGYAPLAERDFPPAPGQGIVCATARPGTGAFDRLAAVDDADAGLAAAVERAVIATLGVGCHTPLGTLTDVGGAGAGAGAAGPGAAGNAGPGGQGAAGDAEVRLLAELVATDGSETVRLEDAFPRDGAVRGAADLAARLQEDASHLL